MVDGKGGLGCLVVLGLLIAAPVYFIYDGTASRQLSPQQVQKVDGEAHVAGWQGVYFSHLAAVDDSYLTKKALVVDVTNHSEYILRSLKIEASFKSKKDGQNIFVSNQWCLKEGKPEFRLLAGAHEEQLCVVWLPKNAADLIDSSDYDGFVWSLTLYGHSQPIKIIASIADAWDSVMAWFRPVNR
jgi:hypothetical protein